MIALPAVPTRALCKAIVRLLESITIEGLNLSVSSRKSQHICEACFAHSFY